MQKRKNSKFNRSKGQQHKTSQSLIILQHCYLMKQNKRRGTEKKTAQTDDQKFTKN